MEKLPLSRASKSFISRARRIKDPALMLGLIVHRWKPAGIAVAEDLLLHEAAKRMVMERRRQKQRENKAAARARDAQRYGTGEFDS